MLRIYPVALQVAADAAILAKTIAVHDKDLARQLKGAAASICLNIAEGSGSRAGTRRNPTRSLRQRARFRQRDRKLLLE